MNDHDSIVEGVRRGAAFLYARRNADQGAPFRASAIGGCQRKLDLLSRPTTKRLPLSPRSALTLDHGTLRGKELAAAFAASCGRRGPLERWSVVGLEVALWMPVPGLWDPSLLEGAAAMWPDLRVDRDLGTVSIRGRADIVAVNEAGELTIGDFKSAHSFSWKSQRSSEGFDPTYLAQLGFYQLGLNRVVEGCGGDSTRLRRELGLDLDVVLPERLVVGDPWILYESKDDHEMFVKVAQSDAACEAAWQALLETGKTMIGRLTAAEPPPRPYPANAKGELPWQCRYCNVYPDCLKLEGTRYDIDGDPLLPKAITLHRKPQ